MASNATIRMEQLTKAKKPLMNLPRKKDGKTRPEAARFLEKAFRNALKKRYSPKELSLPLKNESVIIPTYLIQKFLSETADVAPAQKKRNAPAKTTGTGKNIFHRAGFVG